MHQAENVPDVCWEYIGIVGFMMEHPGLMGMDDRRVECHVRLAKHYGLTLNMTTKITDHMFDKNGELKDGVWLHESLVKIKNDLKNKKIFF